jgi:Major tropism determinant N-terminal domain
LSEQLQLRRGTATNIASFTGAQGEVVVDTTNNRVVVQDGSTAGGFAAAKLTEVVLLGTITNVAQAANGANVQTGVLETLVTLSGSSTTASVQIPANCIVLAVGARVVTTITGPTSYEVGVTGNLSQFGSGLSLTAGSINYGLIGPTTFYSATSLIITATGGSFTSGQVRLSIHTLLANPSTS